METKVLKNNKKKEEEEEGGRRRRRNGDKNNVSPVTPGDVNISYAIGKRAAPYLNPTCKEKDKKYRTDQTHNNEEKKHRHGRDR